MSICFAPTFSFVQKPPLDYNSGRVVFPHHSLDKNLVVMELRPKFTRNPANVRMDRERLSVAQGDVLNKRSVDLAVEGQEAISST